MCFDYQPLKDAPPAMDSKANAPSDVATEMARASRLITAARFTVTSLERVLCSSEGALFCTNAQTDTIL